MSWNRITAIKQYLHFADNEHLEVGNKVTKVAPLYHSMNDQLVKRSVFHKLLSVDESMVPYFGKHSAKKCSSKANPFGSGTRYGHNSMEPL